MLSIEAGFLREEDRDAPAEEVAEAAADPAPEDAPGQGAVKPLSAALLRDLAEARTRVFQARLAGEPTAARDLLAFALASDLLGTGASRHGLDLVVGRDRIPGEDDRSDAAEAFREARAALDLGWLAGPDPAARFGAFLALPETARAAILAWCTAALVLPQLAGAEAAAAPEITGARIGTDVRALWSPTAGTLFARLSKPQILAVLADCGGEACAARHAGLTKAALLAVADRFFAGDAHRVSPEAGAAADAWLPDGMAYGAETKTQADGPVATDPPPDADGDADGDAGGEPDPAAAVPDNVEGAMTTGPTEDPVTDPVIAA